MPLLTNTTTLAYAAIAADILLIDNQIKSYTFPLNVFTQRDLHTNETYDLFGRAQVQIIYIP